MLRFVYNLLKFALLSTIAAAVAAKFLLKSRAEPDTEELDMVTVFSGSDLASVADPFYGGKVMGMFSGTRLDLRRVQPAPTGVHLDLALVFSGLQVVVPVGWQVRSHATVRLAGMTDDTVATADPDSPVLHLTGYVVASGVQVVSKPTVEVVPS